VRLPLGLLYLSSVLIKNGIATEVYDFQDHDVSWTQVEESIQRSERCLVGFSCDSDNIYRCLRNARRLLERYNHIKVVYGGAHISSTSEVYVGEREFSIKGEGEWPLLVLAKYVLEGDGTLDEVPSLVFSQSGTVCHNPVSNGPYENVNAIPLPDYSVVASRNVYYSPTIVTARGCMYECFFCSEGRSAQKYRPRSMESIRQEVLFLKNYYGDRLRYLGFSDDTFTSSKERVFGICDILDGVFPDKRKFGFFCEGRVNVLAENPEMLSRLKDAGLIRLQIGIESGNQDTLDAINKKTRREQIEKVVTIGEQLRIPTMFGVFLVGLPLQSEEHIRNDIAFAKHLVDLSPGRLELSVGILSPLPGTEFRQNAAKWGIDMIDPEFVTGTIVDDCFISTDELCDGKITEYAKGFRSEIDRHIESKISRMSSMAIKESFIHCGELQLLACCVRKMCMYAHALQVLKLRARKDVFFLHELPEGEFGHSSPLRSENEIVAYENEYVFNRNTFRPFSLSQEEMRYYRYFTGKLTFEQIFDRTAAEASVSCEEAKDKCMKVYQKCEDNLAAVVVI
jgi:radical SAM superfamily enzyme YgiQ (UPF0313 family)